MVPRCQVRSSLDLVTSGREKSEGLGTEGSPTGLVERHLTERSAPESGVQQSWPESVREESARLGTESRQPARENGHITGRSAQVSCARWAVAST